MFICLDSGNDGFVKVSGKGTTLEEAYTDYMACDGIERIEDVEFYEATKIEVEQKIVKKEFVQINVKAKR